MRISTGPRNCSAPPCPKQCREQNPPLPFAALLLALRLAPTRLQALLRASPPPARWRAHRGEWPVSASDKFLNGRVIVRQPETGFRAGLDAVMLAAAVPGGATALELGTGAGTASLCLAARLTSITITGIEIDRDLVQLANGN